MNIQVKIVNGKIISRGIEWTDFTWNPVGGCQHACRWRMPDGKIAICYAESTANVMNRAYPHGFEHHYFREHMLSAPLKQKKPSRIFMDSMSDLMGSWVPEDQINRVFEVCRKAEWHNFQLLTKNAPRLLKFDLPPNVWAGVSAPPTFFMGKELTLDQQRRMVFRQLDVLDALKMKGHPVCWMSIEPLSFDIAETFEDWSAQSGNDLPLHWAVIGAASNGSRYFQPETAHTEKVHSALRDAGTNIFHKGNLEWTPHLEEFPL